MAEESMHWEAWEIILLVLGLIAIALIILFVVRWYIRRPMYNGPARIDGKTIVITGGNAGIGKETARDLLKRGGKVVLLCRDTERGKTAMEELKSENSEYSVSLYKLDLADLSSVRECASILKKELSKIDILINNAGVMLTPKMETKDGFEMQFGTNHLGHFLFTLLLLENIKAAAPSRIINVASLAHVFGSMNWDDLNMKSNYDPSKAYSQSKLANVLFTKSLAQKLKGTGVTVYALHPGVVATELTRHIKSAYGRLLDLGVQSVQFFYKSPTLGAQTSIYCAVDESISDETGLYYSGCARKSPSRKAQNMEDAERLWKESLEMVGLGDFSV